MAESFNPKQTRRDFLKFMGAGTVTLSGEMVGLGNLSHLVSEEPKKENEGELSEEELRTLEMAVFPKIQELLKKPGWKDYCSVKNGVYFLANDRWVTGPKELRTEIQNAFYSDMEKIGDIRSLKSGINTRVYVMMTAKESNFGTSELAQTANNPFSINIVGKQEVLSDAKYPNKIKWNDDDTIYAFYKFASLGESCQAFEELHAFWKTKFPQYKNLKTLTPEQSIEILAKYWNAGKNGAKKDYTDWLERVTNKRF